MPNGTTATILTVGLQYEMKTTTFWFGGIWSKNMFFIMGLLQNRTSVRISKRRISKTTGYVYCSVGGLNTHAYVEF